MLAVLARIIALVVMVRGINNINILLVQIIHVVIIMIIVILRMIVENIMIHQWMFDFVDVQIIAINGMNSEMRHHPLLFHCRHLPFHRWSILQWGLIIDDFMDVLNSVPRLPVPQEEPRTMCMIVVVAWKTITLHPVITIILTDSMGEEGIMAIILLRMLPK